MATIGYAAAAVGAPTACRIAFAVVKPAKTRSFQAAPFDTDFDGNADVAKSGEHDAKTSRAPVSCP